MYSKTRLPPVVDPCNSSHFSIAPWQPSPPSGTLSPHAQNSHLVTGNNSSTQKSFDTFYCHALVSCKRIMFLVVWDRERQLWKNVVYILSLFRLKMSQTVTPFRLVSWPTGSSAGTMDNSAQILFSLFCRKPLWTVLAWAGMSIRWPCPSSIFSASHSTAHHWTGPEGWFGEVVMARDVPKPCK